MDNEPTIRLSPQPDKQPAPDSPPGYNPYIDMPTISYPDTNKRKRRKRNPGRRALFLFLILLLVGGSILSIGYYFYYTNIHQPLAGFMHQVNRGKDEAVLNAKPLEGRSWNILLLGSDNDQKYTFPVVLTQVMMLVHIDNINHSVYMVSIPRDSWVFVPEVGGMHKIDQAFFLGATQNNSFDNGVHLARLTVEKDYGVNIDRYAWIGLSGFAKVIDTVGGIDIDVVHPIVDDTYPDDTGKGANPNDPYAFKRLYIPPGPQHLNGEQALEYVRTRHADLVGDIGRTQRQQQVLEALKHKLNIQGVLANFSQLVKDLSGQIYTDMSEDEIFSLANFGRTLNNTSVQRLTLGPQNDSQSYGESSSVYDPSFGSNQDVIIPNCETIQPTINKIFGLGDVQSCNVTGGNS